MRRDEIDQVVIVGGLASLALGMLALPLVGRFQSAIDTGLVWFGGACVALAAISVIVWICHPRRG